MKRLIIPLIALVCSVTAFSETKQALVLHTSQGGEIVYLLDETPKVTFSGQQMLITTTTTSDSYPMEEILKWTVRNDVQTEIEVVEETTNPTIIVDAGNIKVLNPQGAQIRVFSIDGRQVAASSEQETEFTLPQDIYVVTVGTKSFKVFNK